MGCCGTPALAQLAIQGLIDRGAAAGTLVKLVYIGSDTTVRPYTVDGNVYMFGNTERRRVNAVAARVAPFFTSVNSPHYGKFAVWDEALHNPDGSPLAQLDGSTKLAEVSGPTAGSGAEVDPGAGSKKKKGG